MDLSKVDRVVVYDLDNRNREWLGATVMLSLQDNDRTLKIYVEPHPTRTREQVAADIHSNMAADLEQIVPELLAHKIRALTPDEIADLRSRSTTSGGKK